MEKELKGFYFVISFLSGFYLKPERGIKQTAYQILVASTPEILAKEKGDLWDSGKVAGDQSIQVEYAGKPLASRTDCHWKVRVWDKDGKASDWSQPALWRMGLLNPEDWQAKWIGAGDKEYSSLLLRRDFTVKPGLQRAVVARCMSLKAH